MRRIAVLHFHVMTGVEPLSSDRPGVPGTATLDELQTRIGTLTSSDGVAEQLRARRRLFDLLQITEDPRFLEQWLAWAVETEE